MRCCLPVLNEHGRAQRGQFLCCHQLADERMALGVQTPRLCGVSKQVRQELVVLGHCIANVLFPQSSGVAIQLHGAAVRERKGRGISFKILCTRKTHFYFNAFEVNTKESSL